MSQRDVDVLRDLIGSNAIERVLEEIPLGELLNLQIAVIIEQLRRGVARKTIRESLDAVGS
jgi:hypothetical protein